MFLTSRPRASWPLIGKRVPWLLLKKHDSLFVCAPMLFRHRKKLKKIPKTVLVLDTYNRITEEDKHAVEGIEPGMEIHYEERATHYSLVILCGLVFRFHLNDPLVLTDAEIWFTRSGFSRDVFLDALNHYSDCEIRNGM
jgi:hypothetical protein